MTNETTQPDADEGIDTPVAPLDEDEGTVDEPTEDVTDDGDADEAETDDDDEPGISGV